MFFIFYTFLQKGVKSLFFIGLFCLFFTHLGFGKESNFVFLGNCSQTTPATNESTADGEGTFTVTSGVGPFTYQLFNAMDEVVDDGNLAGLNASVTWNDLKGGTYRVDVMGRNGTESCTFTIGLNTCALDVPEASTAVNCANDLGTLTAEPINGVMPLTYLWSNGATTPTLSDVAAGMYTVTVTDNAGCTAENTGTITANSTTPVAVTIVNTTPATDFQTDDGSLTYSISGGASLYNVVVTNTQTNVQETQNDVGTGNVMLNLLPGNYTILATDMNDCTGTNTFQIGVSTCLFALDNIATIPTDCDIANNTLATVSNNRGVEPITYAWSNDATTASISNLLPGTYTVTATDAVGCQSIISGTIEGNPPLTLTCNTTQNNMLIGGTIGAATVTVGAGNPPYAVTLYRNNEVASTFSIPNAGTSNINNLAAGQYKLKIVDDNSCPIVCSFEITEPTCDIEIQLADLTLDCIETTGDLQATISGGNPPYTINWSNNVTTALNANLPPGMYTITVKDAVNCEMTKSATIFTKDKDGDGYFVDCVTFPAGALLSDCNDNDDTVFPGAPEICDDKDNDCNGQTDEVIVNGQPCPSQVTNAAQTPIPTMSEWGLMVFGLLMLNLGIIALLYRERMERE